MGAVDVSIMGADIPNTPYTAVMYNTDTSSKDQSKAKIGKISRNHAKNKDDVDIKKLLLWDPKTKFLPVDIFVHFKSVKVLQIMRPSSEMAAPVNGHFLYAKKLEQIFITNQAFKSMGFNVFEGAPNLQWLYLEHDLISSLDKETFRDLKKLKKLSLQGNHLHSLHGKVFSSLLDLEFLNLKNNLLTSLPTKIFEGHKNLKKILLDVNRLLMVPALEMPANFDTIQLSDNLCVNEMFHHSTDLNKVIEKSCNIPLSLSQVLEAYKIQEQNPQSCDDKDKDQLLKLAEDIKSLNAEIEQLKHEKDRLKDVLESVSTVPVCSAHNEF